MFQYNGNVILDAISCHMYDVDVMRLGGSFQTEGTPPSQGQVSICLDPVCRFAADPSRSVAQNPAVRM
jgi:hypothetical protein